MSFPVSENLVIERSERYGGDLGENLVEHLEWYRHALVRKCANLSEAQLTTPVPPVTWSPLGLVQHLGWVERRWLQWGFAARQVDPYPDWVSDDDRSAEFVILSADTPSAVFKRYEAELEISREVIAGAEMTDVAALGGRFTRPEEAPALGDILLHLVQEYARHVGQLDVVRQSIDGATGE
ncbi:DinB family protein [Amycolatopsis sp. QT-25]|uniref:DinB family protein n=1 Tax=Amycolatopsis sp. QT-25 TaxID=3034022 RepID=UPI0023ED017A|nr:DinB family protein [Amycolatopsis sp. QT-25]WET76267.1 DinB family protein [Amycolatopsis sp. QT-25]